MTEVNDHAGDGYTFLFHTPSILQILIKHLPSSHYWTRGHEGLSVYIYIIFMFYIYIIVHIYTHIGEMRFTQEIVVYGLPFVSGMSKTIECHIM